MPELSQPEAADVRLFRKAEHSVAIAKSLLHGRNLAGTFSAYLSVA
jgi:hypothetical protein